MAMTFNVAVFTPYFGGMDWMHVKCMQNLREKGITAIHLNGCPYIDMARAELTRSALEIKPKLDVIFWIDQDIIFEAQDVLSMSERLLNSDYGMIGAAYILKKKQGQLIAKFKQDQQIEFYKPGIYESELLGFGFTAVKREVYEKLNKSFGTPVLCGGTGSYVYPYYHHTIENGVYYGEDISFCKRVQKAGFKIGLDVEPRIWHKGSYCYALEDSSMFIPQYDTVIMNVTDKQQV